MGKRVFKARSGRAVRVYEDGSLNFDTPGYLNPDAAFDAAEWFQAERDAALGRWRSRSNPDWVVYPQESPLQVRVVHERTGRGYLYDVDEPDRFKSAAVSAQVALEYFGAHPVRQPWHDAKPGEFWRVTHWDMVETCRVDEKDGALWFVGVEGWGHRVEMLVAHHSIRDAVPLVVAESSSQAGLASIGGGL